MRFNSLVYWAFLALVVGVLWALPKKARRWWLLGTSYLFYGSWHYPYLLLVVGIAALNHFGAMWIAKADDRPTSGGRGRQGRGTVVLAADLLILGLFKYLDWGIGNVNGLAALFGVKVELPVPGWVLPLGVSFYIFESMSYVIDVMRKRERIHGFWDLQLFVAFFPKLIAGPILRAKELLPQLEGEWGMKLDRVQSGLWMVVSGLFVKIVLADGISQSVDKAFARAPESLGSLDVLVMAAGFGMQIYFDFSGYSRIAIGSARLCGIELVENFKHPYVARSPADFWNRWHISLSRWIRDYLFYPLVGKKASLLGACRAAIVSMTLCGIWHGAGWTFIAWGAFHGLLIAGYHVLGALKNRGPKKPRVSGPPPFSARVGELAGILVTFALVTLGWIFFRADTLGQAFGLLRHLVVPKDYALRSLGGTFYLHVAVLTLLVWIAPSFGKQLAKLDSVFAARPLWSRFGQPALQGLVVGVLMVACLVYLRGKTAFIYFQF